MNTCKKRRKENQDFQKSKETELNSVPVIPQRNLTENRPNVVLQQNQQGNTFSQEFQRIHMAALQNLVEKIKPTPMETFQTEMSQISQNNQHKCHLCRNTYATLDFLNFHLKSFHGSWPSASQTESQPKKIKTYQKNLHSKVELSQPDKDLDLSLIHI